jgi:L-aminopeptidase/D-esterase-like protein
MRFLGERDIGHYTPLMPIPIVPAAVVFDLGFSRGQKLPDAQMGYAACTAAQADTFLQGNVGAGAGVTVGKWGGFTHFMKGGFGLATLQDQELVVAAVAVTNAVGDIVDNKGEVLAGAYKPDGGWLVDDYPWRFISEEQLPLTGTNTTLVTLWTNAVLNVAEVTRLAQRAHDGMALAVRPVHATHDGDTAFALAFGLIDAPFELVANMGVTAVATAIRNSVRHARTVGPVRGLAG